MNASKIITKYKITSVLSSFWGASKIKSLEYRVSELFGLQGRTHCSQLLLIAFTLPRAKDQKLYSNHLHIDILVHALWGACQVRSWDVCGLCIAVVCPDVLGLEGVVVFMNTC